MLASIQQNVAWRAIPVAGIAAGTAFLITIGILMPLVLEVQPDLMVRYTASLLLGEGVLMESGVDSLIVGLIVHYALSIFFTLIVAVVVHRGGMTLGLVGGAILGLSFYLINLYTMTVFFEWFFAIHSLVLLIAHVVFGMVAGGVYEYLDRYDVGVTIP